MGTGASFPLFNRNFNRLDIKLWESIVKPASVRHTLSPRVGERRSMNLLAHCGKESDG
jgi:hypothetical protein